jgi:hypothetical protein
MMSATPCTSRSTPNTNGTASAADIGELSNTNPINTLIAPKMKDPIPPPFNPPMAQPAKEARPWRVRQGWLRAAKGPRTGGRARSPLCNNSGLLPCRALIARDDLMLT